MRFLRGMYRAFRRLFSPGREKLDIQVADAMSLDDLFDESPMGPEGEGSRWGGRC